MSESKQKRSGWRRFLPESLWTVVIGPIVVALVIAGATAAVRSMKSEGSGPELQALEPVVHNGIKEFESVPISGSPIPGSRQTNRSKARIEIRLKNVGKERAYLTAAIFTVRRLIEVPPCGAGSGVIISSHYDVVLPRGAAEGESVEIPIDQQIDPDGVDRFVFSVGRNFATADLGRTFVYELNIAVAHDGRADPTDVGQVLVALPGSPRVFDLHLDVAPVERGCLQDALDAFGEAASLAGTPSPQLERILAAAQANS